MRIDRRTFLKVPLVSGGGFLLACHLPGLADALAGKQAAQAPAPTFISIRVCYVLTSAGLLRLGEESGDWAGLKGRIANDHRGRV